MTDPGSAARETARDIGDHDVVEKGARLGYAMSGLIHLVIGWLALDVAWGFGAGAGSADKSGALETVAGGGTGAVLLWLAVIGFVLLAVWQATETAVGRHGAKVSDRLAAAGKAVLYAFLAWSAFRVSQGTGGSDEQQTDSFTGSLMSHPGGRVLVAVIGLAIIGAGGHHAWKGWTKRFLNDLDGHPGTWAVRSGRAGYLAKGVALGIAGLLFVGAAASARAAEAGGLDAALKELRDRPFGPYLLTLVAVGILAYGLYSFARARHAKL